MTDNGPIEPSAVMRTFAATTFDMFNALILEGFTERQALVIIGQVIASQMGGPSGSGGSE